MALVYYCIIIVSCLKVSYFKGLAGSDYVAFSSAETFTSGSNNGATKCVAVTILDDIALEGNQNFTLALTTADLNVLIETSALTISIVDEDSKLNPSSN